MFITLETRNPGDSLFTPLLVNTQRISHAYGTLGGGCCVYFDTDTRIEVYLSLSLDELERVLNCETPGSAAALLRARKPNTGDRPSSIGCGRGD
jgi:hypothetical protein